MARWVCGREIAAALAEAAAEGGVRQLAVNGDEEVWVAGVAAVEALSSADAEVAFVSPVGGDNALTRALHPSRRLSVRGRWYSSRA
jgi:hypothetical protein